MSTTYRRTPQQKRGEERVSRLLDAAASVIEEVGYEAATMTVIAQRADASIGSLYQFFPHKDAIVLALKLKYLEEFEKTLRDGLAQNIEGADEFAEFIINARLHLFETHPAHWRLIDAPASTKLPSIREQLVTEIADMLIKLKPPIDTADLKVVARMVLKSTTGFAELYARAEDAQKKNYVTEYKRMIGAYLRR